jgi:2'-5' RNA ligase
MPRLFTGIEIPETIGEELSYLRGGIPGARWIDADLYHLTIRFVGDIDPHTANEIAAELARVHRPAFQLKIEGVQSLGSSKPHTIAARLAPSQQLSELQATHERIMQRIGLPAEPRKYTPHITLARVRGARQHDLAEYLSLRGGFTTEPFEVDRFVLFSSRDNAGGGPYLVEEAYPLVASHAR